MDRMDASVNFTLWGTLSESLPSGQYSVESRAGETIWADTPDIRRAGDWRPEELKTASHPLGRVAVYGSCLASDTELRQQLDRALELKDPRVLTEMPGSYTTLLFEPGKMTALADLANQYPFFYRSDSGSFRFSSLMAPLRDTGSRPDALTFAAQIASSWSADVTAGRSVIEGVQRLEAGHMLQANHQGNVRVSQYESFQPTLSYEEAVEALREALLTAVRGRAAWGRKTSSDFSGGLDSTSIAYLTARETKDPLLVMTRHAPDAPLEDVEYVRRYLQLPECQGLFDAHEFEHSAAETMYAGLDEVPIGDGPDVSIRDRSLNIACYRFLRQHGSELHLTGVGGDGVVDLDPRQYLGEFDHLRTYPHFLRSVLEVARTERNSPLAVMADIRRVNRLNPSELLRGMARLLEQASLEELRGKDGRLFFGPAAAPTWLTVQMRKDLAELARSRADELRATDFDWGNYQAYADLRSLGSALHGSMQVAVQYGLREHAPYMDNAVLRACFNIAAHTRVNPWHFKVMLGDALKGLVPDAITRRSTKGNYTRHAYHGLRSAVPLLQSLVHDSRLADMGVVDPARVKASLDRAFMGANPSWASLDWFIAAELWLRRREGELCMPATKRHGSAAVHPEQTVSLPPLPGGVVYGMPKGVCITTRLNGAIALNVASGTFHRLNMDATQVVMALSAGGNIDEALTLLSQRYPAVERKSLQAEVSGLIRQLESQGLLVEGGASFSIMEGSEEVTGALPVTMTRQGLEIPKVKKRDYVLAMGGFAMALALRPLSFARQVDVLTKLHQRWCRKSANVVEVERTLAAAHRISAVYLGRAACLELSLATVLAAALKRQKVDLVLGARTEPDSFHAWPEVGGVPIRTAADEQIVGAYQPILKV